jgi:gamma-glutamylputrescine oxidase
VKFVDLVSLWEATANDVKRRNSLTGEEHCDVVIIGGGFTGLSTAYHLQEKNMKTIVLEREKVGYGASGRNGGQILTGFSDKMSTLKEEKGLETARQMLKMSLDSIDLISDIINKNQIDCSFHRNGHLVAAYKSTHVDDLKKEQETLLKDFDYEVKVLEVSELACELSSPLYKGGCVDENSAMYHPYNYVLGLAEAAEKLGCTIYEKSEAVKIARPKKDKIVVSTLNGWVVAKEIVIVTNGYSSEKLHKTIARSVIPIESIMIATEKLSADLVQHLIKRNRAVYDTKNLLYYFRRTDDNRIAFGGSGRSTSKRDENRIFDQLYQGLIRVFPELKAARIEYRWGGKVGFTRDFLPYIGKLEDGTHFAFGFAGHGAAMSTLLGKVLAHRIFSGEVDDNPLEISDLKPIPFHSQHAKVLSLMKYYYKVLDSI